MKRRVVLTIELTGPETGTPLGDESIAVLLAKCVQAKKDATDAYQEICQITTRTRTRHLVQRAPGELWETERREG